MLVFADCTYNTRSEKEQWMAGVETRDLDAPVETRTPDKVVLQLRPTSPPARPTRSSRGRDAWVVGDEAAVGIEFDPSTAASFAKE
jgi:hypothetical protein